MKLVAVALLAALLGSLAVPSASALCITGGALANCEAIVFAFAHDSETGATSLASASESGASSAGSCAAHDALTHPPLAVDCALAAPADEAALLVAFETSSAAGASGLVVALLA
ncbi:MAG: hypothetical protein ACYDCK_03165 [Thermoplasmatota archaeon]